MKNQKSFVSLRIICEVIQQYLFSHYREKSNLFVNIHLEQNDFWKRKIYIEDMTAWFYITILRQHSTVMLENGQ